MWKFKVLFACLAISAQALLSAHHQPDCEGNPYCYSDCQLACQDCPSDCSNFFFSFDSLYWKACEDGINYGTQTRIFTRTTPPPQITDVNSRIKGPHFDWDWGFRLGIGYNPPCTCWDISVYWTHFHTHTSTRHDVNVVRILPPPTGEFNFFLPAWGPTNLNTTEFNSPDIVRARWKIHVDMVDVEIGRWFCMTDCLKFRPHIGVRAAWINQRFQEELFVEGIPAPGSDVLLERLRLKSDYESVGLRSGLDSEWDLGCGISLYGSTAVSVLYGHYDNQFSGLRRVNAITPGFTTDIVQKHKPCACRAVTDASVGVRWRTCLCNGLFLTCQWGWEHHLFINQNTFEEPIKYPGFARGDLCLKGATFSTLIEF